MQSSEKTRTTGCFRHGRRPEKFGGRLTTIPGCLPRGGPDPVALIQMECSDTGSSSPDAPPADSWLSAATSFQFRQAQHHLLVFFPRAIPLAAHLRGLA
jgi:hypothetical protein